MKITDITPKSLREVSKVEVNSLHRRMHQLWGKNFAGNKKETTNGLTREDVSNAHALIVQEMERRDMNHDSPIDGLKKNAELAFVAAKKGNLPGEIVVVPQFVSIVGSVAKGYQGDDVDVLLRSEQVDEDKLVLWEDNVYLPLRKVLDPKKGGFLHWIANPQGPHGESIPLYDLVLRRVEDRKQQAEQPGLYIVEPHSKMIWEGKKKAIVKSRNFDVAGNRYILVSDGEDGLAWGMIELHAPKVIDLDDFEELRDEHKVSTKERKEWWGDYEQLFYYDIKYFTPFEQPKKVAIPQGVQTFVKDVKLAESGEPVRIDLGCGDGKPEGYIGVDKRDGPDVDVVYNLDLGLPFPDNYADVIRAHHSLEHLRYPVFTMHEIWRVLKPDGILDVAVPSTKGEGAFAHPKHASFWNKSSFAFYCQDELRREIDFLGKFEILWLEEIERGEAVDVRGRLKAIKPKKQMALAVSPWYKEPLPKPSQRFTTDFFSIDELWKWVKTKL